MEQNKKSKASLLPQFIKPKAETKSNALWLTVSFDCPLLFLLPIFVWERSLHMLMCSCRDACVPESVSQYDHLLVIWGFGVPCDPSITVGTWGERLTGLSFLTVRVSDEHKATKPWGIKYRMPGSILTVTPWLVSPLKEANICVTHTLIFFD